MKRFKIGWGIGLVLLVSIGKQLILPGNHILCDNLIDFSIAKVGDDFVLDNVVLRLPSALFQTCFQVIGLVRLWDFLKRPLTFVWLSMNPAPELQKMIW